jgi:hypothetical protein
MADINKTVEITLKGKTAPLKKSLQTLDGQTEKTSKKIADDLDKAFKKAERSAKKSTKKMNVSFKSLGKGAAGVAAAGVAIAAGMAVAAKAVFDFARKIGDMTNQLADASARSGLTVQQLQALSLALEGSGLTLQQMEPALDKFPLQLKKAADGSKKMEAAFKRVGVSVKNTDGSLRDTNVVFDETLKGLSKINNSSTQAATAMELFGKQGGMLIQSGAIEGMEAFNDLVDEFGIKTSKKAVNGAAGMQRALADLKMISFGTGQALIEAFTGQQFSITDLIDMISKGVILLGQIVADVGRDVASKFQAMFAPLAAAPLIMEGKFAQAAQVASEAIQHASNSSFSFSKSLIKANERMSKFTKLSAKARQAAGSGGAGGAGGAGGSGLSTETKEIEKQVDLEKLRADVLNIQKAANSDIIGKRQKIMDSYKEQLSILDKIEEESEGQTDTEQARIDLFMKNERDLHSLKMEQIAIEKAANDEAAQKELDALEAIKEARAAATESALAGALSIAESMATISENQITHLEQRKEKGLQIIDQMERSGQLTAEAAAKQRASLEQQTTKQIAEANMKAFNIKKGVAISTAIIDAISASVRAFADYPFPASGIISGAAMAAAMAQVAAIQSQPPPTFDIGGMIGNRDPLAPDGVNANLLAGEAVLSRQDVRNIGGAAGLKRLQQGGGAGSGVVVISPFKHFDKFVNSALKRPTRLKSLIGSTSTGNRGY